MGPQTRRLLIDESNMFLDWHSCLIEDKITLTNITPLTPQVRSEGIEVIQRIQKTTEHQQHYPMFVKSSNDIFTTIFYTLSFYIVHFKIKQDCTLRNSRFTYYAFAELCILKFAANLLAQCKISI